MKVSTKILIIIASLLIVSGLVIFTVVMSLLGWDFRKLSTFRFVENRYEITAEFEDISVVSDTSDIVFLPSENGTASVVCYEQEKLTHSVKVTDGKLTVAPKDERRWYDYIGIGFENTKITVYLPFESYGKLTVRSSTGSLEVPKDFRFESIDLSLTTGDVTNLASAIGEVRIKTSTGDILTENISASGLDLSVSTGDITASNITCKENISLSVSTGEAELTNVTCKKLTSSGSTGELVLNRVIASESLVARRSTGSIILKGVDSAELFIQTDTGDISGNLLSSKVFIAKTDTGRIKVPDTLTGGRCELTTDTGNITITVGG